MSICSLEVPKGAGGGSMVILLSVLSSRQVLRLKSKPKVYLGSSGIPTQETQTQEETKMCSKVGGK